MTPSLRFRGRQAHPVAVALSTLLLTLAGCSGPDARPGDEAGILAAPLDAADDWRMNLTFEGSGVYVAKALMYPFQRPAKHHLDAECQVEYLTMRYSNERAGFIWAELHVFPTGGTPDGGGGGAGSFGSPRGHVGLAAYKDGKALLGPYWVADDPLGIGGSGARTSGPLPGPPKNETQTLMLVVAYSIFPDDDHPEPASLDFLITCPEPNIVMLESEKRAGGTGAFFTAAGDQGYREGINVAGGLLTLEPNVTVEFETHNATFVRWIAYVPKSPGTLDVPAGRVPVGHMDLTVSRPTGSRSFELGYDEPLHMIEQWYVHPAGEHWRFTLNVTGQGGLLAFYADAPFASAENNLVCNYGERCNKLLTGE